MKFSVNTGPIKNRTASYDAILSSYDDLLISYFELDASFCNLKEVTDVMESINESVAILRMYGESAVKCLNVYGRALEDITGMDEKLLNAKSAIEALDDQRKTLFQRFIDFCKNFWESIKKFFASLFDRTNNVINNLHNNLGQIKSRNKINNLLDADGKGRFPCSRTELDEYLKVGNDLIPLINSYFDDYDKWLKDISSKISNFTADDLSSIKYQAAKFSSRKEKIDELRSKLKTQRENWTGSEGKSLKDLGYSAEQLDNIVEILEALKKTGDGLNARYARIEKDTNDVISKIGQSAKSSTSSESLNMVSTEDVAGFAAGWAGLSSVPALLYTAMAGVKAGLVAFGVAMAAPIAIGAAVGAAALVVVGTHAAAHAITDKIWGDTNE